MTEKSSLPVVYVLDASVAVTGAFVSARNNARVLADNVRTVLVLPKGSKLSEEELKDFWKVKYVRLMNPSINLSALVRYLPALLNASRKLKRWMEEDGAECICLNDFFLMHGVMLRLLLFRGRIISWARCNPYRFAGIMAHPMLLLSYLTSDKIIAVSQFIVRMLPSIYDPQCIYDCYMGELSSRPESTKKKILLYIGNYIEGKGQDLAIKAFAEVANSDPALKLCFYGSDMGRKNNRHYKKRLEKMAQQSGFGSRIHFGDFLPDASAVLEKAYASLNFSHSEALSMTVMEASGAGLPVVATASGGPQEILLEGKTGFLIQVGDLAAAVKAIRKLVKDPALAARMGKAGAVRIQSHFSPSNLRNQLLPILL